MGFRYFFLSPPLISLISTLFYRTALIILSVKTKTENYKLTANE